MSEQQFTQLGASVYAWIGVSGDSNAGAIVTPRGLIVIDAQQSCVLGERFRGALAASLRAPVRTLINTHFHLDHIAGNVAFKEAPILAHEKTARALKRELGALSAAGAVITDPSAKIRMFFGSNFHELVPETERGWFVDRVNGSVPLTIVPPSDLFADAFEFILPDDVVRIEYWGPAHCDGDVVIHLQKARVIFMGDLFFYGRFPWFGDCDLDGWIGALDRVQKMDIATVVPGHGQPTSLSELAEFRRLLATTRSEVDKAIKAGWSEDATAQSLVLGEYVTMPRYKEWMPFNIRATYRYLRGQ